MKPTKKLKSVRGTTFAEVLLVVILVVILLGVAVPDIISYSRTIKFTAMNDNARAVAVAAQSRLYGMKNSGTSTGSEYDTLNLNAEDITVGAEAKQLKYVYSWGTSDNMLVAKQLLFSGAITDLELLQQGYIAVVYDPQTADILRVWYSDSQFDGKPLFANDDETYRKDNFVGQYIGEGSPLPKYKASLPEFSCEWVFDDEMYLQLTMIGTPPAELLKAPLGLEIFAKIPKVGDRDNGYDEVLIYAEGFFATDYQTTHAGKIEQDHNNPLTLDKIQKNERHLRFALDSLVSNKAGYGSAKPYLRHQEHPEITSAAEKLLYPRAAVADWFSGKSNPYLTVFNREYLKDQQGDLHNLIWNENAQVTDYVPVDGSMALHVRLHVLSNDTRSASGNNDGCALYNFDDNTYSPADVVSDNMSPYFYALSNSENSVYISSMRDFNNLSYVFNDSSTSDSITSAHLVHDVSGQEFYEKLVSVRYAAIGKIKTVSGDTYVCPNCDYQYKGTNPPEYCIHKHDGKDVKLKTAADYFANNVWNSANADNIGVNAMNITNRGKTFIIDGKKREGDGNYAISNVEGGGRATSNGGLFCYAENVVFSNIDIVNPRGWRNHYDKKFLTRQADGKLNNIALEWNSIVSGSLVGLAVNCQFDNVHAYIDPSKLLQVERIDGGINGDPRENEQDGNRIPQNMNERRIAGTVVGGLVGMAIGDDGGQTTFTNCAASALLTTEYLFAPSQCVYAGGLVGIAYGGVSIDNCYAACALNGYYSGGLVGAVASGKWTYLNVNEFLHININRKGTAEGTFKMKNSFAAGHIDRLVRVGGGLIACVDDQTKLDVDGCYSAVQWDALAPVAYGTFPGDNFTDGAAVRTNKNYYIAQTDLFFPITLNVEAHFKVKSGDVIFANNPSGIPCTAEQLKTYLEKTGYWNNSSTYTARWRYTESEANVFSDDEKKEEGYPFPMPNGNNNFWGDWINTGCYNTADDKIATTTLSVVFDRYICPNYFYVLSWGAFRRHVDVGALKTKEEYLNLYVNKDPDDTTSLAALLNGNKIDSNTKYGYWATEAMKDGALNYGQGISGATTVVLDAAQRNYVLYGPEFYDPGYDPIAGYDFTPEGTGINLGVSQLNWDYYGFYFTPQFGNGEEYTDKYYVQFDNTLTEKNARLEDGGDYEQFVYVNETTFKQAVGYETLTLPINYSPLQLTWITNSDGSGYFRVQPNGMGA